MIKKILPYSDLKQGIVQDVFVPVYLENICVFWEEGLR